MSKTMEEQIEQLRNEIDEVETVTLTRFTLADAIRLGSTVSGQAYNWTDADNNMCALSSAVVAAKARGYM